jgi:hypothetical protein
MASDNELMTITGLEATQAMLRDAPRHIVASGFAKAGRAAATVFEVELEMRTPVRSEELFNDETFSTFRNETGGDLKAALMSVVELDAEFRGVHVSVGFGKQGHVANWVEFGHRMMTHKPGSREVGFVPAHPFMRPAFEAGGDRAIDAFATTLAGTVRAEYGA